MTKQHFIALADAIREHNRLSNQAGTVAPMFKDEQVTTLANFCQSQNPRFNRSRWLDYIDGKCGPNGGAR